MHPLAYGLIGQAWHDGKLTMERKGNWIGGEQVPSKEGLFELRARSFDAPILGEWPRSGALEVASALGMLVRAAPIRREVLECALHPSNAGLDIIAARLGLRFEEMIAFAARSPRGGFGLGIERCQAEDQHQGVECSLLVGGASMLPDEWLRLAAAPLATGLPLLMVAHDSLPMSLDLARQRLIDAGVAAKRLSVLYGLTLGGWRELGQHESKLQVLGELDEAVRVDLIASARISPGLKRLLARLSGPCEVRFDLLDFARKEALAGASVKELAERLVERAFGRGSSLGGQATRTPLCGTVPEGLYAAFVDATLVALEKKRSTESLLAWHGGAPCARRYRDAWRTALGEGAVLLYGGEANETSAGLYLAPTLLVNLPTTTRSFVPGEPLGQLRLARAPNCCP